jgi:outer membrane lipoprotein-sorting protein
MNKPTILFMAVFAAAAGLFGQSARDIVDRADEAFKGNRIFSTSSMTVYKSGEAQPVQEIESYTMEEGGKAYSLSVYTAPRRMKGTANLMIEDDLWVRFSSTGRVRKLSSSAKKNSAGGSDFSYADMGEEGSGLSEKYDASLLGEEEAEGESCYAVELTAKERDAPYEKMVVYVAKERYHYVKIDYYENTANIKTMVFYDYRTVNGKDYPFGYTMTNHSKPSRTEVLIKEFEVDSPRVEARMFSTRYLETIR